MEHALRWHAFRDRHPAFVQTALTALVAFLHARCALFTPKISHAGDYTGIVVPIQRNAHPPCCKLREKRQTPSCCFRNGSMVLIRFDPVVPVNTGTSVTGIGCVAARPATVPRLPAASRGDS